MIPTSLALWLGNMSYMYLLRGIIATPHSKLEGKCKELSILVQHWEKLVPEDGILCRRYENNQDKIHLQVVAPAAIRKDILRQLHEGVMGGHLGEAKTLSRLKERFYWPGHAKSALHVPEGKHHHKETEHLFVGLVPGTLCK